MHISLWDTYNYISNDWLCGPGCPGQWMWDGRSCTLSSVFLLDQTNGCRHWEFNKYSRKIWHGTYNVLIIYARSVPTPIKVKLIVSINPIDIYRFVVWSPKPLHSRMPLLPTSFLMRIPAIQNSLTSWQFVIQILYQVQKHNAANLPCHRNSREFASTSCWWWRIW